MLRKVLLPIGFLLFSSTVQLFGQLNRDPDTRVVGRAGSTFISEKEFIQRFEMLPALYRKRSAQLDIEKLDLMSSIIAEKLLAEEARSRNLHETETFQNALLEIRKLLARDQLYREEISANVVITRDEITTATKNAMKQVLVDFMFFDRLENAAFVRAQIKRPRDFETLAIDSSVNMFRDTATVIWGDADPVIEESAYEMKVGDISPVVSAGKGWYILQCVSITPSALYSSMEHSVLRERVLGKIRQRKEKTLMDTFLATAFLDKSGYAKSNVLKSVALALKEVLDEAAGGQRDVVALNDDTAIRLRAKLQRMLSDTLVVVGSTYWSVDDVISRLVSERSSLKRESASQLPGKLNEEVEFWVQQELLGQEAIARGLDERPEVKQSIETWQQALLADMMKMFVKNHVSISGDEVWTYLRYRDSSTVVPKVQLRNLRTSTLDAMESALAELEKGVPFEQVIETWSNDADEKAKKGLTSYFAVTELPPIGGIAAQMEIGQRYGPIRVKDGFHFFELVAKRSNTSAVDTALAARTINAEKELLAMKQKRTLTLLLAQLAQQRGFEIFQDRLLKLDVTPIPMMTFRFLGFGGRMFEMPFVEPQTEWLNIEPPKERILP